jgi:signal transduction histidine kinase/ligand-binding sensor domain-containing protein
MNKIFLVCLLFWTASLPAQYKTPYFNMLTIEDGLPQAFVSSNLEDKYGYLWLGTSNGLVRYDGYRLKQYPILNEEGLPANPASIAQLFEDSKGVLWASVRLQGFYRFDRQKDVFVRVGFNGDDDAFFKKYSPNGLHYDKQQNLYWATAFDPDSEKPILCSIDLEGKKLQLYNHLEKGNHFIPASNGLDLSISNSGKIWLVTDSLLSVFDAATQSFKPFFALPKIPGIARFFFVRADPVDENILWVNTSSNPNPNMPSLNEIRGLLQFNVAAKSFRVSLPGSKGTGTIQANCFHMFTDSLKRVWISTSNGISLYDRKKDAFSHYPLNYPNKETHAENIAADKEGNLWILGIEGGFFFIDIKTGVSHTYEADGGPGSLPANRNARGLFFDRSGTLWVNVVDEGMARLDRHKTLFAPVAISPFLKNSAIKELPQQYVMVGTEGDSICYLADTASLLTWNTITNRFTPIDLKDKSLYKTIFSITKSKNGSLWISCGLNGVVHYEPATGNVHRYRNDPKDSNSQPGIFVVCVAAAPDGIIWVGTADKGINSFNPKTGKFTQYPFAINNGKKMAKDSLDDRSAGCLYIDKDGIIWIGTSSGSVNSFDPRTQKFRSYLNYEKGFFGINSMYEDSRKRFWVSTYNAGLYLLDTKTGALKQYSEKEGLIYNSVFGIKEDAAGNIWAATYRGMSRINPVTNGISNFGAAKPWLGQYLIENLYDRNGYFNLVGRNGIIRFNPLQLNESKTPPDVHIESVGYRLPGEQNDTLMFTSGREKLALNYNENRITIQYVGLHFANPEQNRYAYRLENYDKDWIQAGTQRSVTYSNLEPGNYTFKVKASNGDGVWNETGASFVISITPPWWKTWWAYGMYALMVILGGYLIYKYQKYYIVRKERERTQQKELAQAKEIEKAYTELKATQAQLIQSEKMASLGELTAGIAHEIQNPLNFVNNFSEVNRELVDELQQELKAGKIEDALAISNDIRDNEEKINYHGKRADAIVKSMLQHSRSNSGQKEPTDLNALCDEYLRLAYHGLKARDRSFNASFHFEPDTTLPKVNVVSQDIGRVLLNLINNAFQAVGEKVKSETENVHGDASSVLPSTFHYEPLVTVSTKKLGNNIEISVKDNGAGIPDSIKDKIFQPFFTTKPTGQGTGLGLSLSYDIIKAHGGELKVETKESEGSTFTIQIPVS